MPCTSPVLVRIGSVVLLAVICCAAAAAESYCLTGDLEDSPTLAWNECTTDEQLSVALGMLLHSKIHDRYAPINLDSALLMYGFDHAKPDAQAPIDMQEAREILRQVRPPASSGERYAWRLYRLLDCANTKAQVIMRALGGDGGDVNSAGTLEEHATDACLDPVKVDEKSGKGKPSPDATVRLSYRRDIIGRQHFKTLSRESTATPLNGGDFQTSDFALAETIKGWQAVVPHMTPDRDYEVVIPPSLGYGERGIAGTVEPSEYLRFVMRVECNGLEPAEHPFCPQTLP